MPKETAIVKREQFTVASAQPDQYGNLQVKSTEGKEYKIGEKRPNLFPVFQPGATVEVGYAEYMNKAYIATAVLVAPKATTIAQAVTNAGGTLVDVVGLPDSAVPSEATPLFAEAKAKGAQPVQKSTPLISKNAAYALSYAKDLAVAGKIEKGDILSWAKDFVAFLDGEI